jgi:electron transfer flavoprotein alpha subunit
VSSILVFVEQRDGQLKKASLEALGEGLRAGSALGLPVHATLCGADLRPAGEALSAHAAARVWCAQAPALRLYSPDGYATAVAAVVERCRPQVVFFAATAMGKDLAARLSARLDAPLASDCTAVRAAGAGLQVERPVYSGKAVATVELAAGSLCLATLRPSVFDAAPAGASDPARVEVVDLAIDEASLLCRCIQVSSSAGQELDVAEAEIVVSGGRAMKGPEQFGMLKELAEALGGAVGASRAAVDAGWIDHQHQVGQTGKTISPGLYIACGISGAIQHLAGMSSSKVIVAINKDAEAPIFKLADYGVVGDLFQIVPLITREVRRLKGS